MVRALSPWNAGRRVAKPLAGRKRNGQRSSEAQMDWDDARPKPKAEIVVGAKLDDLSVADLEQRIAALQDEIARVEREIANKRARAAAADALFKL
jgi:uncharacterized small protein (DUF1192 family)